MKLILSAALIFAAAPVFAGGLNCSPEGCIAVCGSVESCMCDPAHGYTCNLADTVDFLEQVVSFQNECPNPLPPSMHCRELRWGRMCFPENGGPGSPGACHEYY